MTDPLSSSLFLGIPLLIALGLVHATLQLGVSVLTLMSGHSLGYRRSLRRLLTLNTAYIVGSIAMTTVLVSAALSWTNSLPVSAHKYLWVSLVVCGGVVAIAIVASYYRASKGTALWIPRPLATYLTARAKRTRMEPEAAVLGATAVCAELPFSFVIVLSVAQTMSYSIPVADQFFAVVAYAFAVNIPLVIITMLLGGGHRLSTIQRWREANKRFLQYIAATGFGAIALYVLVFFVGTEVGGL